MIQALGTGLTVPKPSESIVPQTDNRLPVIGWFMNVLIVMMALRISSYFTLFPDSVALTRVAKIGLRFLMTGMTCVWLTLLLKEHKQFKFHNLRRLPLLFYCLYLCLGYLSLFWTTNLFYTVLQLIMTTETMVFSYLFYRLLVLHDGIFKVDIPTYAYIMNRGTFWINVIFIAGIFYDPDTFYRGTHGGEVHRLGGYIINPNELGMLAVVALCGTFYEIYKDKVSFFNILSVVVGVAVLLLSQSRSSLGAFALVAGIYVLLSRYAWIKMGSVIGGALALPVIINTIILKTGDMDEIMSMTGRLPFWKDLIQYGFPQSPIYGFGFMSISPNTFSNKFPSLHSYAGAMTHNSFIQVLINLGLAGAFICFFQLVTTFHSVSTTKNKELQLLASSMLIPLIINSLTEFGIFGETNYGIMFYQFVFLFFCVEIRNKTALRRSSLSSIATIR